MASVVWAERARADLHEIHEFIARDSPAAANAVCGAILDRAEGLERFPRLGPPLPELPQSLYRQLLSGSYRIVYRLTPEEDVLIMAVLHQRRQIPDLEAT